MDEDLINSDLEAPVNDIPQEGDVERINPLPSDVPASDFNEERTPAEQSDTVDPWAGDPTEPDPAEDPFNEAPAFNAGMISRVPGRRRNLSSMLLAIALAEPGTQNDIALLSDQNLQATRDLLDDQQEYNARLRVAAGRAVETLKHVDTLRRYHEEKSDDPISAETKELINQTYRDVTQTEIEETAKYVVELEAAERVRDFMTQGDYHEAYLVREEFFGEGGADQRKIDYMAKSLLAAQRLEELEAEYEDSGWVRGFFNGIIRMVPFLDSFSASGILDDAGINNGQESGLINFILRGQNLEQQREALWGLDLKEFAEAMSPDGPVMKAIRANADWILADPTRAKELGTIMFAQTNTREVGEDFFGGLDAALVALPALARTTRMLRGMGARKAATDLSTKAILETISKGPEEAAMSTAMKTDEVVENLTPSAFNASAVGVGLSADIVANLKVAERLRAMLPDLIATHRLDNPEDLRAAFEVMEKNLKEGEFGEFIKDVRYVEENLTSGKSSKWKGTISEDGATLYKVEVFAGKKAGGGYARKSDARGHFERFQRDGELVQDDTGQWFAKFEVSLPLDGFITGQLDTPDAALSYIRSSARTSDEVAHAKGVVADNAANRVFSEVAQVLKASRGSLGGKERTALDQVILKGNNEAKWYDPDEFAILYERQTGELPSDAVQDAYSVFRSVNDLEYLVRNDALYMRRYNEGFETHKFGFEGRQAEVTGKRIEDPKRFPLGEEIWDASARRYIRKGADLSKHSDEGKVLIRLEENDFLKLPNGDTVKYVMVSKGDLRTAPLNRTQLNYSQGGSRAYDATHFIKQAAEDGSGALLSPRAYIAGKNLNEMREWADRMNEAIGLFRRGERDPMAFDDIFKNRPGFPAGDEFIKGVDSGEISTKHLFEVVEDQGMPSAYFNKDSNALKFVDTDEYGIDQYYRGMNRLYYGSKGEILKDVTGKPAATIDPWETLNSSLQEAARTYTFSGYKTNVAERFANTYGGYLVDDIEKKGLFNIANAEIKPGVDSRIVRRIKAEQAAIHRLMNFETAFEKRLRHQWRGMADWVLGDAAEGTLRSGTRNFMYWLEKNNPVQAIRTLTFDANLGFFNIGQLFIQTSTMGSAIALSPRAGMKGAALVPSMKYFAMSGYRDDVLDVMTKNGVWKMSFDTADEFKEYARFLRDSNLYEVNGHNLSMIRDYGANKLFGAAGSYNAVTEKGRMFFYFAEQANRTVASRIAWQELREQGLKVGTAQFKERFAQLTDDYSLNMMSASSAGFQHGLPSVPTQFWAYAFRMMDALMGKRFTPAQRMRLLGGNMLMAGAAGVPGGAFIQHMWESYKGEPVSLEEADGWLARGLFDGMTYVASGADIEIGKKIGTADLITTIAKDIMGQGEYGEKSVAEMVMGASGGKLAQVAPALWDVAQFSAAEQGVGGPLEQEAWLNLAKEISTVKNAYAGFYAYQYGVFKAKSGTTVAAGLPETSAFFFAAGFGPGEQGKLSYYFGQSEGDMVKDAASRLSKWRQEAFTVPDKFEENRQKAQAFMSLFPPHLQVKIRKAANKATDDSMYDSVVRRYEADRVRSEFYDEIVPEIKEGIENGN